MSSVTTIISTDGIATRVERRRFRLRVVAGPAAGTSAELSDDQVTVGSADGCDVTLADRSVSRQHARLEVRDDGIAVRDLGSTNGTCVDGLRVECAYVPDGARLRLGDSELELELTDAVDALPLSERSTFGELLGRSVAMRRVFATLERVERSDATVLVQGESGTGKEMVAEALHARGPRRDGPFVIVDCGALPPGLIESELFGHDKGAFTGAVAARAGAFELAHGGTLFLDEIGELDPALQPRLLRAIDRHRVKRVGGTGYIDTDVRIIAATHRDLDAQVASGAFREDLFYRLAVVRVHLPPLRARSDDVELLARRFIEQLRARHPASPAFELSHQMVRALAARPWRGNVRELRNFVERAVVLATPELLAAEPESPAPPDAGPSMAVDQPYAAARERWVGHFEREYVTAALRRSGGNVARAARECAIDRAYLFRLIKKHDLGRK